MMTTEERGPGEGDSLARKAVQPFSSSKFRRARESRGLTAEDLGRLTGVAASTIRHWETGHAKPGARTLKLVAGALGVPTLDLLILSPTRMRLVELRQVAGLTHAEVLAATGLSRDVYARIERGAREPSATEQELLGALLQVDPAEIKASWQRERDTRNASSSANLER